MIEENVDHVATFSNIQSFLAWLGSTALSPAVFEYKRGLDANDALAKFLTRESMERAPFWRPRAYPTSASENSPYYPRNPSNVCESAQYSLPLVPVCRTTPVPLRLRWHPLCIG